MPFESPVPTPDTEQQDSAARTVQLDSPEVNEVSVVGEVHPSRPQTLLRLASGQTVAVPTAFLLTQAQSSTPNPQRVNSSERDTTANGSDTVISLIAEQLEVSKQTVTTGTVRLHKAVETYMEDVTLPLTRTGWDVERTSIGQLQTERPEVRQEGDVTVFPLVEERLVAKREYFLLEEVRIRRVEMTTERTASIELKRDVLTVERDGVGSAQ